MLVPTASARGVPVGDVYFSCLNEIFFFPLFACTPREQVFGRVPEVGAAWKGHYQMQNFSLYNLGGSM